MDGERNPLPPDRLDVAVPKIYLNSTDNRDRICLLPAKSNLKSRLSSATQSNSLPDLVNAEPCVAAPRTGDVPRSGSMSTTRENMLRTRSVDRTRAALKLQPSINGKRSELNVYCSPRSSRRTFWRCRSTPSAESSEDSTGVPTNMHEMRRLIRSERIHMESTSSADSEGSLRSVSHLSVGAPSDCSNRYVSCDRLSTIPLVNGDVTYHPSPLSSVPSGCSSKSGRLRRIFSSPEAQFLKEEVVEEEEDPSVRDSKSCSNLVSKARPGLINHLSLDQTSHRESNLLSPPPPMPLNSGRRFEEIVENRVCNGIQQHPRQNESPYRTLSDNGSRGLPLASSDNVSGREARIRRWLQEVQINGSPVHSTDLA